MLDLIQSEADYLFALEKNVSDQENYKFPAPGDKLIIPLISIDKKEEFLFDMSRSFINLKKITYQNRARKILILRRLDIEGSTHKNPESENIPLDILKPYNGSEIPCPHLHIYIEGYDVKWAIPANDILNLDDNNLYSNTDIFLDYCNVIQKPNFQSELF